MYVIDTDVLSQSSPTRRPEGAEVAAWMKRNGDCCYLSAVTIIETSYGVAWLRHRRALRKAATLQVWLDEVLAFHRDRIIAIDANIATRAGQLLARARSEGVEVGTEDAIVAATGELGQMTVLTNNDRHFAPMGIRYVNPSKRLPPDVRPRP
jgi:predicted nucleic acid-binding protein